jgi:hypothetical protein
MDQDPLHLEMEKNYFIFHNIFYRTNNIHVITSFYFILFLKKKLQYVYHYMHAYNKIKSEP